MRTCKRCGQPFKGWWCRCGKKGKRGGRPRRMSVGCGTRGWRVAQAKARMLGGWDEQDLRNERMERDGWESVDGGTWLEEEPRYAVCGRCGALFTLPEGTPFHLGRCPVCWERVGASRSDSGHALGGDGLEVLSESEVSG